MLFVWCSSISAFFECGFYNKKGPVLEYEDLENRIEIINASDVLRIRLLLLTLSTICTWANLSILKSFILSLVSLSFHVTSTVPVSFLFSICDLIQLLNLILILSTTSILWYTSKLVLRTYYYKLYRHNWWTKTSFSFQRPMLMSYLLFNI